MREGGERFGKEGTYRFASYAYMHNYMRNLFDDYYSIESSGRDKSTYEWRKPKKDSQTNGLSEMPPILECDRFMALLSNDSVITKST